MEAFVKRVILSLFDWSGNWPWYFERDGFEVIQVDIKLGQDIMTYQPPRCKVYGILAAPPCTQFSVSGSQYWAQKDADGRTEASLALVARTLDIIQTVRPEFWMIEQPVGRLRRWLGPPVMYFNPCDYAGYAPTPDADAYNKKTCLWGRFSMPRKRPVEPVIYEGATGKRGSWQWALLGGKSERTKELRSTTPMGFSIATWVGNR